MEEDIKEKRLSTISQRVGFVLWQIQELENILAHYLVILTKATKGMGLDAGEALIAEALSKPFGATISQIIKGGLLSSELESRFKALLSERNWLVHSSRITSRSAIHNEKSMNELLKRLHDIDKESLLLMNKISTLVEQFVKQHGVSSREIEDGARLILEKWHNNPK